MLFLYIVGDGNWYMHFPLKQLQDGATPLFAASQNGHSDVVNILIRNGADVNLSLNVCTYNDVQQYGVPVTHYRDRSLLTLPEERDTLPLSSYWRGDTSPAHT